MTIKSVSSKLLSLSMALLMMACGQKTTDESTDNAEAFDQAEAEVKEQIVSVVYEIPSPSEIPFLLKATGAEYNEALVNDITKIDKYEITNDVAAMNLGVYTTDMGYLISYDKVQEALNYLSSTKNLADHLGITGSINLALLKRFEKNLGNKDSLAFILNEAVSKTDDFLIDDQRSRVAALLITGSFIEGLYISTELIKTYPKDLLPDDSRNLVLTPLIRVILEQEKSLNHLLDLLETIDQANPVGSIKNNLLELRDLYKVLNIQEQIENSRPEMVINDETLISITEKVAAIRKSITE